MALTPKIASASMIPSAGRLPVVTAAARTDSSPLTGVSQYNALVNDGAGFRYEQFSGDRRNPTDYRFLGQHPPRRINTGMLTGTSQSFAEAFDQVSGQSQIGAEAASTTTMSRGASSYELMSKVIYNERPELGKNLSMTL